MEKKNVSLETFHYWPAGATGTKKQANPEVGLFESCPVERLVLTAALLAVLAFLLGFHAALVLALLAILGGGGAALAGLALSGGESDADGEQGGGDERGDGLHGCVLGVFGWY